MAINFIAKDAIRKIKTPCLTPTRFAGLLIVLFMCIAVSNGFCFGKKEKKVHVILNEPVTVQLVPDQQTPPGTDPGTKSREPERLVPISREIIRLIEENSINFKDLNYYLSLPITLILNETSSDTKAEEGKLVGRTNNDLREIPITIEEKGTMVSSSPRGSVNFFEISFTRENVILVFKMNQDKNCFDLVSAKMGKKHYVLRFEKEKPYLVINYPYIPTEQNIPVQGFTFSSAAHEKPSEIYSREVVVVTAPSRTDQGYSSRNRPPDEYVPSRQNSNKIMGVHSLNKPGIVAYIQRVNPAAWQHIEPLVDIYFSEAVYEGVNADIAIAQMLYATNFLRNAQRMKTYNYAGLSTSGWKGYFYNETQGVRAHIQHLKGYATGYLARSGPPVDPRYDVLKAKGYLGSAKTLGQLSGKWAPANPVSYQNSIEEILQWLYSYSDKYRSW